MKKRFLGLVLSLAAIFALVFPASAATYTNGTWSISHSNSSIYGETKSPSCISRISASYTRSGVTSKCTSYYSQSTSSGSVAYAHVSAVYDTAGGETVSLFTGDHRTSSSSLTSNSRIPSGATVTVNYTAKGATSVYYGISGTLAFK